MIFLDSGFLYAYINIQDTAHTKVVLAMKNILLGYFGSIFISNFIYDEVLTLARFRTKSCTVGEKIQEFVKKEVKGKKIIHMIIIDSKLMEKTNELYGMYCKEGLSYTDCSILATMNERKIEHLATIADEFNGKVTVIN